MLGDILSAGFQELGISCEIEAIANLRKYHTILEETNKVMNLTAITGDEDVARLHFLDCAALLTLEDFTDKKVLDVGSGAGFPGMVLKIVNPKMDITLMDSLEKRVNFLKDLSQELKLEDVHCIHMRAEEAPPEFRQSYDIVVSRAVAKLELLCELCLPFVKLGGKFIAMKGPAGADELKDAENAIKVLGGRYIETASYEIPGTDKKHNAVIIEKVAPTPAKYPRRWAQIKKAPL